MSQTYKRAFDFATTYIAPVARELDEKAAFPEDVFKKLGEEGFLKLLIPEDKGGLGGTVVDHVQACRAFAQQSASVGLCYMMHNVALRNVLEWGSEELIDKVVDDVVNNGKFLALANSEFGTGTHFYNSEATVEIQGDTAIVNGRKSMVTSGSYASYYISLLPSTEVEGSTDAWLIPLEAEGLAFEPNNWNGLGMRSNVSMPATYNNMKVPVANRIGEPGTGPEQTGTTVTTYFITGLGGVYSGLNEGIFREAQEHATSRVYPDGTALADLDTVQNHLSQIYVRAQSGVQLVLEAACAVVAGEEDAAAKILACRINAGDNVIESARLGMRIGGGKAYNKQGRLEQFLRDAYANQIMAPSIDVLNLWLGRALTGRDMM